jgi:hypothetical protein
MRGAARLAAQQALLDSPKNLSEARLRAILQYLRATVAALREYMRNQFFFYSASKSHVRPPPNPPLLRDVPTRARAQGHWVLEWIEKVVKHLSKALGQRVQRKPHVNVYAKDLIDATFALKIFLTLEGVDIERTTRYKNYGTMLVGPDRQVEVSPENSVDGIYYKGHTAATFTTWGDAWPGGPLTGLHFELFEAYEKLDTLDKELLGKCLAANEVDRLLAARAAKRARGIPGPELWGTG